MYFFSKTYNILLSNLMNLWLDLVNPGLITIVKKNFIYVTIKGLKQDKAFEKPIFANLIHSNVSLLISLFLATSGISILKKIKYILISFFILFLSHFCHLYLDIITIYPPTIVFSKSYLIFKLKLLFFKTLALAFIFWEQLGRWFFPFILWIIFTFRYFVKSQEVIKNELCSSSYPH